MADESALTDTMRLLPAESMALTVGREQARRGEPITPNIGVVLVATLDRLTGVSDWTAEDDHGLSADCACVVLTPEGREVGFALTSACLLHGDGSACEVR